MEDLVEVILGEIRDEHEPGSDVTEDGHGGYIVSGNFDLARLEDLAWRPPRRRSGIDHHRRTDHGVAGACSQTGRILSREGIQVEILASDDMRVEKVRLSKMETPAEKHD